MLWKLAPSLLCSLVALLTIALDYWWTDRRRREFKRGRRALFVCVAVLGAASACGIYWEAQATGAQITDLQNQVRTLQDTTTGGNSFAYVSFIPVPGQDEASLWLVHQGSNPLYNVQVLLHDLERPVPQTLPGLIAATPRVQLPELGANAAFNMATRVPLSATGTQDYTIQISARNGWLTQAVRLRRVKGEWLLHTVVWRIGPPNSVLYTKTVAGFPPNAVVTLEQ